MTHDINFIGYLDNALSELETKQVTDHLATCPECREVLDELEKNIDLFTRLSKQYPDMPAFDIDTSDVQKADNFALSEWTSLPSAIEKRLAEKSTSLTSDQMHHYLEKDDTLYSPKESKTPAQKFFQQPGKSKDIDY
jgi:hypothetical protein